MSRAAFLAMAASFAACGTDSGHRAAIADSAVSKAPADSLVVSGPGVEIWFTLSRPGVSADGTPCTDRAIELRRGSTRIPVPLLYTREAPSIMNDTTARAVLYTGCVAGDAYLVDLRSGRPTREHR